MWRISPVFQVMWFQFCATRCIGTLDFSILKYLVVTQNQSKSKVTKHPAKQLDSYVEDKCGLSSIRSEHCSLLARDPWLQFSMDCNTCIAHPGAAICFSSEKCALQWFWERWHHQHALKTKEGFPLLLPIQAGETL